MKRGRSKQNKERIRLLMCFFLSLGKEPVNWLICLTSEGGLKVDVQAVPRLLADSTQHPHQEEGLRNHRAQDTTPVYFSVSPLFKKSVPLMRYSRGLLFHILHQPLLFEAGY